MSEIQSITFKKRYYSKDSSKKWLLTHNYKPIKAVDETKSLLRYRIQNPKKYKRFITKKITPSINFIIGFK